MQTPSLSERLDALEGHYHLHFAGRPRATRDPAMLDAMLDALRQAGPSDQGARIASLQQAWQQEREHIVSAQATLTPRGVIAARTLERVERICARLPRLARIAPPGCATKAELVALEKDLDEARAHLLAMKWPEQAEAVLRGEFVRQERNVEHTRSTIRSWRVDGLQAASEPDEARRRSRTVAMVQRLVRVGETHVEGRPQHVVRPQMLFVLADALEEMAEPLGQLRPEGVSEAEHEANCLQVRAQVEHWRGEAEAARQLRRQRSIGEMASALLDEADVVLEAAEATPPGTTPMAHAASVATRMDEVLRQLEELPTAFGLGNHAQATLGIADCLAHLDGRLAHISSAGA